MAKPTGILFEIRVTLHVRAEDYAVAQSMVFSDMERLLDVGNDDDHIEHYEFEVYDILNEDEDGDEDE